MYDKIHYKFKKKKKKKKVKFFKKKKKIKQSFYKWLFSRRSVRRFRFYLTDPPTINKIHNS